MLKFYLDDFRAYREAYDIKLNHTEAEIIYKKLSRHYKIHQSLLFRGKWKGRCSRSVIKLPRNTCLGLLLHEVAHAIDLKKREYTRHDKRLRRILDGVNRFAKKKGYWKEEVDRRTAIKVVPVTSEEEKKKGKIDKSKEDLIRYEKRLRYFTRLYTTKIRSAKRSIAMLERGEKKTNDDINVMQTTGDKNPVVVIHS